MPDQPGFYITRVEEGAVPDDGVLKRLYGPVISLGGVVCVGKAEEGLHLRVPRHPPSLEAVGFDLDHVLVSAVPVTRRAFGALGEGLLLDAWGKPLWNALSGFGSGPFGATRAHSQPHSTAWDALHFPGRPGRTSPSPADRVLAALKTAILLDGMARRAA